MTATLNGAYGADDGIVDYILGITFEIWEQRRVDLIDKYYGTDTLVYGLDRITCGSAEMIGGTRNMLGAFPDRLLLADDVIWSGSREDGYYSSHRIVSPMTNKGPTLFGPATNKEVRVMAIADCVVEEGVITREWLLRDNYALVTQLGHDPIASANIVANSRDDASNDWISSERERLINCGIAAFSSTVDNPRSSTSAFALQVISNNWVSGDRELFDRSYSPYAVAHRSPVELYSGREAIESHYSNLRKAMSVAGLTIDHVAVQPADSEGLHVAVRWSLTGSHVGNYLGATATNRPVFVMGSTHWRIENNRIAKEWTVFDGLGVLSQLI